MSSDSSKPRNYPEMSDVVPIKCETCRFWTMTNTNRQPWGYCGGIRTNTEISGAYLSGEHGIAGLDTLPHFWCSLWKGKLADSDCANCGLPIFFNGTLPAWQHKNTGYAACHLTPKGRVRENAKWAEPKGQNEQR